MNFIEEFKKGQSGTNKGIPFGDGLESLTEDTSGIHKGRMYVIGGAAKSGKTTFVDYAFILQPFLYCLDKNIKIKWKYFSFEIDRVSKEFDFMTYFLHRDYGIEEISLDGQTKFGKNTIPLSPDFLRGYILDDNNEPILVDSLLKEKIKEAYYRRIVPLFGEFDSEGRRISEGLIDFIENKKEPDKIQKDIIEMAKKEGKALKRGNNIYSFSFNSDSYYIVIIDHVRKISQPVGMSLKQTVDRFASNLVELRKLLKSWIFVPVVHTNRDVASTYNMQYMKGDLYPNEEHIKDTGNLSEDTNYLFTVFNPNDDKYALQSHFGLPIRDSRKNPLYPEMRTIHLVSSRHCPYPRHYRVMLKGNLKKFKKFNQE